MARRLTRSPEVTSSIMSAIRAKNTGPERILASAMWRMGLRPVKHKRIFGTPDFTLVREKIAIFCDGDFWHGNNWRLRGFRSLTEELRSYSPSWRQKIRRNIKRDRLVSKTLRNEGYIVLRYWESAIRKKPLAIASRIKMLRDRLRAANSENRRR
jgi:DNA mismatch endonuclease (patch repair protein)